MATVHIPHYFDVVYAIESAVSAMSSESGVGICQHPYRLISTEKKCMGITFTKFGDKNWKSQIWVEKIGGNTKSSAYRIVIEVTGAESIYETVYLTNSEQLADLALHYAEIINA